MKRVLYILLTFLFVFGGVAPAGAQVDRRDVRKGNRDFKKENYREAEIDYRKALVKDSLSLAANYNLANTLYKEGNHDLAGKCLETVKDIAPASASAADYYFNLGDVAIARQDWQGAVDAFKESLLRNPGDLQAKENYIYAKKKLEDQQNQQDQNQQNDQNQNDQNQDQNDQNQNQDQDDQNKDQQNDQQNQNNDQNQDKQNDQDRQNQQGQQPKISPQAAQQMLQAIQAKEKETQEKVNKQKAEALKSRQKEKNW
ncbi:MAG: tetratricopeptide repeat protein [Bacteroidales bacterium]|nr:tetratricopeptide repeat protein [Bacteroidales bacterium]